MLFHSYPSLPEGIYTSMVPWVRLKGIHAVDGYAKYNF